MAGTLWFAALFGPGLLRDPRVWRHTVRSSNNVGTKR
ncbi:hypothetical protein FHU13_003749 [Methylobacterium sp. R2-1]|nr:hypothetical protein [Methylobacterium sp. R2-1]